MRICCGEGQPIPTPPAADMRRPRGGLSAEPWKLLARASDLGIQKLAKELDQYHFVFRLVCHYPRLASPEETSEEHERVCEGENLMDSAKRSRISLKMGGRAILAAQLKETVTQ
jgi:hypothetical protein